MPFTEKLFQDKAGKSISQKEKANLQKQTICVKSVEVNCYDFMFDTVMSGHPIAISLAGNYYKNETLESLFTKMKESEFMKIITEGTIGFTNISR